MGAWSNIKHAHGQQSCHLAGRAGEPRQPRHEREHRAGGVDGADLDFWHQSRRDVGPDRHVYPKGSNKQMCSGSTLRLLPALCQSLS